MIIVSDTTPISELAKVDHLDLLPKLFGKVVISQGVFDELQVGKHPAAKLVQDLPWLEVVTVDNQQLVRELQLILRHNRNRNSIFRIVKNVSNRSATFP